MARLSNFIKSLFFRFLLITVVLLSIGTEALARQEKNVFDPSLFSAMKWRNIGPYRGGRSTAVHGVPTQQFVYYMGATGGGLWKTTDGGTSWNNVSDGFFKTGTVGAIAVAPSDPNVIYVGMGEAQVRGVTTSHGDGVYKSLDAGKTWTHIGLEKSWQISTVRVHPQNPDLVYVAVQGNYWAPNPERGVYRSKDGGDTWEQILHINEKAGASDLSMDANNPRILYAGFWEHQRLPWKVNSGGEGSGVHKSVDGGDTWKKLEGGLPDFMGKVGVSVSPANSERVWAIVEAEEGGLFRSDNGGKKWERVNKQRVLRARSWYYTKVFADPVDEETVYVLNAPVMKSVDGGKTFTQIQVPHGDNHDLWINPNNNKWIINANDGGGNVSFNGGKSWSTQTNQPTAQFYRVITDNQFPYKVYGGQQDNSSAAVLSRTSDGGIGREDWHPAGGCESAFPAFDPDNPVLVYAGCYQGIISEYNHATRSTRSIMAHPYLGLGTDAKDNKYRFNWNAPIFASPHDPSVIYHAGNVLLKTEDRGQSWTEVSPDLTRNEVSKQGKGGGPITNEAAGAETYNTIMYAAESPHEQGVIWVGTDDGLVHLTRDGGENWANVTPNAVGEALINNIEVSPHDAATAYIVVAGYKLNDFSPHIYKTANYGKSWTKIVSGIREDTFVRAVREDPKRKGLLYAGTEAGMFVSFNDGKQWQEFQLNLPVTPITDITIRRDDLVASTQGRAFWILDDFTPLHQLTDEIAKKSAHLFKPRKAFRMPGGDGKIPGQGQNPPNGTIIYYHFTEAPDTTNIEVKLEILDDSGNLVRTFLTKKEDDETAPEDKLLPVKKGMNRFVWDFRTEGYVRVPKLFVFGSPSGYRVAPGTYTARLTVDHEVQSQEFEVAHDPRLDATAAEFAEYSRLQAELLASVNEIHAAVNKMRSVKKQVAAFAELSGDSDENKSLKALGDSLTQELTELEEEIVQPKQETFQDVINFPNKLNANFVYLMGLVDEAGAPVTQGAKNRAQELQKKWSEIRARIQSTLKGEVDAFNQAVREKAVPAVVVPKE